MQFYSGFSLQNEEHFFKDYLSESDYCVSGFSYGAIKAFEYVEKRIDNGERIDRLQLFSPAFFQSKSLKFKRLQHLAYKKNKDKYIQEFIASCFKPYEESSVSLVQTKAEELNTLLEYIWEKEKIVALTKKGLIVEVFLGENDLIIDAQAARDFFIDLATVTYVKNANHFLQIK